MEAAARQIKLIESAVCEARRLRSNILNIKVRKAVKYHVAE